MSGTTIVTVFVGFVSRWCLKLSIFRYFWDDRYSFCRFCVTILPETLHFSELHLHFVLEIAVFKDVSRVQCAFVLEIAVFKDVLT